MMIKLNWKKIETEMPPNESGHYMCHHKPTDHTWVGHWNNGDLGRTLNGDRSQIGWTGMMDLAPNIWPTHYAAMPAGPED